MNLITHLSFWTPEGLVNERQIWMPKDFFVDEALYHEIGHTVVALASKFRVFGIGFSTAKPDFIRVFWEKPVQPSKKEIVVFAGGAAGELFYCGAYDLLGEHGNTTCGTDFKQIRERTNDDLKPIIAKAHKIVTKFGLQMKQLSDKLREEIQNRTTELEPIPYGDGTDEMALLLTEEQINEVWQNTSH